MQRISTAAPRSTPCIGAGFSPARMRCASQDRSMASWPRWGSAEPEGTRTARGFVTTGMPPALVRRHASQRRPAKVTIEALADGQTIPKIAHRHDVHHHPAAARSAHGLSRDATSRRGQARPPIRGSPCNSICSSDRGKQPAVSGSCCQGLSNTCPHAQRAVGLHRFDGVWDRLRPEPPLNRRA